MTDVSSSKVKRDIPPELAQNGTKAILKVNFPQKIEVSKEDYIYPFLVLYADIGGYVTILLGISAFDVFTWIYSKIKSK